MRQAGKTTRGAPGGIRVQNGVWQAVQVVFFALWMVLLLSVLVSINTVYPLDNIKQNSYVAICLALLLATGVGAMWLLGRWADVLSWMRLHPWRVFLPVMVVVVCVQVVSVIRLQVDFWGWDAGMVIGVAGAPDLSVEPAWQDYFSHYSNNLFLLFAYRTLFGVFDFFSVDRATGLTLLNLFAVDAALVLAFAAAKRLYSGLTALAVAVFAFLVLGFSTWILVPYSDTLSMPFVAGAFFAYTVCISATKRRTRMGMAAVMGLLLAIGILIKPTVAVLGIAILLVLCIELLGSAKRKQILAIMAVVVLVGAGVLGGIRLALEKQQELAITPNISVPMEHFMAMGLVEKGQGNTRLFGSWHEAEVLETWVLPSTEEMREMNREKWKSRLAEMGPGGYTRYLWDKLRWISLDGTFFWGGEGTNTEFENQIDPLAKWVYPTGQYYQQYRYGPQAIWICVILFSLVPAAADVIRRRTPAGPQVVLQLAILGLLCFILLFEGRSRYLINFLPLFCILAGRGYSLLVKQLPFGKGGKRTPKPDGAPMTT